MRPRPLTANIPTGNAGRADNISTLVSNPSPAIPHTQLDTANEDTLARAKFGIISNLAGPNPFADTDALRDSQVVVVLKIEPKLGGQAEVLPQANGGVGTDGSVSP